MSGATPANPQFFSPAEMMVEAEKFALAKTKKDTSTVIGLAIMAGIFIGLAFVFYVTVTTGSTAGWGMTKLVGGVVFSMGLILTVICGGELFTSTVLTAIAWANKQVSASKMFSLWGKVYLGNLVGSLFLVMLIFIAGMHQLDAGQWGLNAMKIAQHKLHHDPMQAFVLGILCNMMVCLAVWLSFSSASAMTKAAMTILPVAMFVSSGFEHCVANMFMVPMGIAIQTFASDAFWVQIGVDASQFADLNVYQFITANLIPVTLGNIVGGAGFIGLSNWWIFSRPKQKAATQQLKAANKA